MALGMALTAQTLQDGALVRNVILFSVLVYELVGPTLTKKALLAAGEINPEGRVSHRGVHPHVPQLQMPHLHMPHLHMPHLHMPHFHHSDNHEQK